MAQPAEWHPLVPDRWRLQIVKFFGEFAAALSEQRAGRIELIGGLGGFAQRGLKCALFVELPRADFAGCQMRINLDALALVDFKAGVEDQQGSDVFAASQTAGAHSNSPSWLRSLRVARNSEFFTVSSVVPRASP